MGLYLVIFVHENIPFTNHQIAYQELYQKYFSG